MKKFKMTLSMLMLFLTLFALGNTPIYAAITGWSTKNW